MDPENHLIRITREEASSAHVDDLLKRQMSLRGEAGITRSRGRRWFYQNWFVLMIAGIIGAMAAWALIEPFFNDVEYLQGKLDEIEGDATLPRVIGEGEQALELRSSGRGWIKVNGERIWLLGSTRRLSSDGKTTPLNSADLEDGQTIGVYAEYHELGTQNIALARFIVPSPPPQPPVAEPMTLSRLHARTRAAGMLLFPLVAGLIGLCIGAADGIMCRLPRRALLAGAVGVLVGFIGGFISSILANLAYAPLTTLAMRQGGESFGSIGAFGFLVQMAGRSLAWCIAGMTMGLGQGIALRSHRLLLYGLIGGVVGGLLGGLFFDPIDLLLLGPDKPSSHWSRLIGFAIIGASVGGTIGIVELLARDAWLRMTEGPLAGKEFLIFKDLMTAGASPRSDIYLFNDPLVAPHHATIRGVGDECEIEAASKQWPLLLNNRPITQARLRHGDQITIGKTIFVFQKRQG